MINNNTKRRLISLTLATSMTLTSLGLTGCTTRNKSGYLTKDKQLIYEQIDNGPEEWFCDIYVEDYNENILEGAKFELRDESGNIVDSWTSTKSSHRLINLENKIYTLTEVSMPEGYIITGNNTWIIDPKSGYRHEVLGIKNIREKDYISNNEKNILNTGEKEYIKDEYFVLKIKESYDNRMSKKDHLEHSGKLPKYILLKGTLADIVIPEYSNTIQYQFNDVNSDISFDNTSVVLTYNGDGSYTILLYRTYLGIKGKLTNDNLYIVPITSLTNEELEELEEEHMNYPKILDKLHSYDYDTPKSRVLTK